MGDAFFDAVQEVVPSGRFDRTEEFWGVAGNDAQIVRYECGTRSEHCYNYLLLIK